MRAGDPLMDGPRNPHDILAVLGEKELQKYLVNEIQEVYRLQGVNINDKHLEVISRQMMRWVKVEDIGDTRIPAGRSGGQVQVPRRKPTRDGSGRTSGAGQSRCCSASPRRRSRPIRSSRRPSFQETTRVLTEAAINGKVDYLRGLKENVIMGRLVPAGTGMEYYRQREDRRRGCGGRGASAEQEISLSGGLDDYSDETPGLYIGRSFRRPRRRSYRRRRNLKR